MKRVLSSDEMKTYEVVYVNSADRTSYTQVQARDTAEARKKVKK